MESHLRSLMKAFSWRIFGSIITIMISYIITGRVSFSLYIGFFDFMSKIILFYLHERVWNSLSFGLSKKQWVANSSKWI
ncbi:MAG: hypothetical protein A3F11_07435 [Gammaproteobacteria bacterium RIFCSPHIGHO2_12_FULL_37_14]|nr:MAG: hypothetical protein A3F11_07435 [Gammaproteobacteria bacterium RIFCSPHIGHO2_12_FULL_37_14]